jgi:integrase
MARSPEVGNVKLYPDRPLRDSDHGFVLQFFCPIQGKRVRRATGTRDRREARQIQKECTKRLISGEYIASEGLITAIQEQTLLGVKQVTTGGVHSESESNSTLSWESCKEQYVAYKKSRLRESSFADLNSRLNIAERILTGRREIQGLVGTGSIAECCSLSALEYLQDRLLDGDECRYDWRSPMTVNSSMGVIMAFVRYCERHDWIAKVPHLQDLDVDNPMKGRPITESEFEAMLSAVPEVVGDTAAESWQHVLRIIWTTAFRVGDVMSFSWNDKSEIHPLWPDERREHPTIMIPSKQKNRKNQEIPMLPELEALLIQVAECDRKRWIANPLPINSQNALINRPSMHELKKLCKKLSNIAIAEIYQVTEAAVRKWLSEHERRKDDSVGDTQRLTKERVGRVIGLIGQKANVVVQEEDSDLRKRLKYASAHDIRRGCAQRLINQGVSAESLKLILRHSDFATTEKFYGAVKSVQSASNEIRRSKGSSTGETFSASLSKEEIAKLRTLLDQI